MFLFTAVWMKSLRKMTLSPVWTKGACSAGGENSLSGEQNQRAEPAWRHPHPTQSPEAIPTPQSQQLPLPTANSSRRQCWSPSHRATSQPLAPGAQLGPRSPARLTQAVVCGSGTPRHKFPQTRLTHPRADPTPCTRQSPMRLAEAHPGRANTRHNQALVQDGP